MFRRIWACTRHDLRRLTSTPRAWAVLILTVLFIENQFAPVRLMLKTEHLTLSWPGMTMFLMNDAPVTMLMGLGLLMLLFDAPFTDEAQRYLITRAGRGAWGRGQVLYVLLVSVLYILAVAVIQLILQLPYTDWSGGWSSALDALARDGLYETYDTMLMYDVWLLDVYTPLTSCLLVMSLHVLAFFVLALIQFVVNVLGGGRVGFLVAAAPLIFDSVIEEFFPVTAYYFSPVTLSRISALDYGDEMGRPPVLYAFAVLGALAVLFSWLGVRLSKRREIML